MSPARSDDDEDDAHDLVRAAGASREAAGAGALAHVVDQANREAAANRAQARELIKALEGVQRSHEYLGTELRNERRRGRWLVAALVAAPIVASVGAWFVWERVDGLRADVDARLARLAADQQASREEAASNLRDARVAELAGDLDAAKRDLDASRDALAAEREHLNDREALLAAAQLRGDSARVELGALDAEVKAARAKANAEQQRANQLEDRIQALMTALAAKQAAAPVTPAPAPSPAPASAVPAAAASAAPVPPDAVVRTPDPPKPAADAAAVEKARTVLNQLLAEAGGSVRYQFEKIGNVTDEALLDVRLAGVDETGAHVRTIVAARAQIVTSSRSPGAVLRFTDGKLLVGTIEAPFFDGTYGLIVAGDAARWRATGLACVRTAE